MKWTFEIWGQNWAIYTIVTSRIDSPPLSHRPFLGSLRDETSRHSRWPVCAVTKHTVWMFWSCSPGNFSSVCRWKRRQNQTVLSRLFFRMFDVGVCVGPAWTTERGEKTETTHLVCVLYLVPHLFLRLLRSISDILDVSDKPNSLR